MRNAILKTTLAALVLSSSFAATEASAKVKEQKFHFVSGAYEDYPVYEMKFQNGNWKWINKGKAFKPRMKVYSKHNNKHGKTSALFTLEDVQIGYIDNLPKKYEKLVTLNIGSNILKVKESAARGACKSFGGSKKVIKDMGLIGKFSIQSGQMNGGGNRTAVMKAKVVCHPKTASSGTNTSGGHKGPILAALKLYSIPAKPKCGQPVTMVAQFQTHNQGKINFLYHRSDGKKQKASVVTTKVGKSYMGQWKKTYTFNESVNRKYAVLVKDQNKSTQWVPLKVTCTKTSTGGKAS